MFEGFWRERIAVGDVEINCVIGGEGPPVLLIHGAPQTHAMWADVAPLMAKKFTVVCPDIRGYGASSKPRGAADNSNYTFRVMAQDLVSVMERLGHTRFSVAGHDRGARVAHRMVLDHPERVKTVSMLDIVPTYVMYKTTDLSFATTFWLWFFLPTAYPQPEKMIGADPDFFFENLMGKYGGTALDGFNQEAIADYRRAWHDPDAVHGLCSDYRAGISRDLEHDEADLGRIIDRPTQVLWAANGLMGKQFDFKKIWSERCSNLVTGTIPGGHFFPDEQPKATAEALMEFIDRNG